MKYLSKNLEFRTYFYEEKHMNFLSLINKVHSS